MIFFFLLIIYYYTMDKVGSLSQFLNVDLVTYKEKIPHNMNKFIQHKKHEYQKMRIDRVRTLTDAYQAEKKSQYPSPPKVEKRCSFSLRSSQRRRLDTEVKLNMFPKMQPKEHIINIKELSDKMKLKREERLLRSELQIQKEDDNKEVHKATYEDSFDRLAESLNKVSRKRIFTPSAKEERNAESLQRQYRVKIPHKSPISDYERIQYERILQWMKKHKNQHKHYYERKLGKKNQQLNLTMSQNQRRQFIKQLSRKYRIK